MKPAGTRLFFAVLAFLLPPISLVAGELPPIRTVFVIMMENKTWSDIIGSTNAPYLNKTLLPMAAHCENYQNLPGMHPSLPNYLWIEAGTNFGIFDDGDPIDNHQNTTNHLVTLLDTAGISWRAYQENISGTNLPLSTCCGYSARHNPFVYFDNVTGTNDPTYTYGLAHIRPYSELCADLTNNTVARYNFIIPSDCNDMHTDCSPTYNRVLQGDMWLSKEIPPILNSPAYTNGGVLFIAWDESYTPDTRLPFVLVSPFGREGYGSTNYYDHSSLIRTLQEIFGVTPLLGAAQTATNLSELFAPFGISKVERASNGVVRLTLAGLTPGTTNVVLASTNLANWPPLTTNVAVGYKMIVTDDTAANVHRKFYRLMSLP